MMTDGDPEGKNFYPILTQIMDSFYILTIQFCIFILK